MTSIGRAGATTYRRAEPRSPLFLPAAFVLAVWVIFGGSAPDSLMKFGILAFSGSAMLVLLVVRGEQDAVPPLGWAAWGVLAFFCLMPLLQLVPLPPALWHALPGRELSAATLAAAGRAQDWHPLTLTVQPTLQTLLMTVWLIAQLMALLQLSSAELRQIFLLLFVLGLLNVAIGIVQVVSGQAVFQFFSGINTPFLNGLFANKNHTGLFIALTFLTGYAALLGEDGWNRRRMALAVPGGGVLFVALIATFSRAGVIFGLMAIGFVILLSIGKRLQGPLRFAPIAIPIVGILTVAAISSTDLASRALARFGGVNDDLRWSFWQWSWPLVIDNFPFGSGIGSFTSLFPPHEQLGWVKPTNVNHIHSDYIEHLLEVGIAAPIAWLLVASAIAGPARVAWAMRGRQSGRLALISLAMLVLVALHSAFDYPLRRPAIPATCMVAFAALLRFSSRDKSRLRLMAGYARQHG